MPPGAPFNSLALPYNIRVDKFTNVLEIPPQLHLLSHTHTDHLSGLSSRSFASTVICSHDAKEMLLRYEAYAERDLREYGLRAEAKRTFAHLCIPPVRLPDGSEDAYIARDLLRPLPLEQPTKISLSNNEQITLTLFDANHCPGAVMFLIEGPKGAVLHTGDIRAEPSFIERLKQNRFLKPYMTSTPSHKALKAIYLDTACLLSNSQLPSKVQATKDLVEILRLYPDNISYFINAWTWGYEDVLKALATAFRCKIHVDKYKYSVYMHTRDTAFKSMLTLNPRETRFHACERFDRCDEVAVDEDYRLGANTSRTGRQVVYINPVTIEANKWTAYVDTTKEQLSRGKLAKSLLVGLSRHSSRPELTEFVSLFRPENLVPNTLSPDLLGYDHLCLHRMFANCLSPPTDMSLRPNISSLLSASDFEQVGQDEDIAVLNIIGGDDVSASARRWGDRGGFMKKFRILKEYLSTAEERAFRSQLPPMIAANIEIEFSTELKEKGLSKRQRDANDSDIDSDDERGRTAAFLFGNEMSSFASASSPLATGIPPEGGQQPSDHHPATPPDNQSRYAPLTPQSSPTIKTKRYIKSHIHTIPTPNNHSPPKSDSICFPRSPQAVICTPRPLKRQRTTLVPCCVGNALVHAQSRQTTVQDTSVTRDIPTCQDIRSRPSINDKPLATPEHQSLKQRAREERRIKRAERANLIAEKMSQSWATTSYSSLPIDTPMTKTISNTNVVLSAPITRESTWVDNGNRGVQLTSSSPISGSRILSSALKRLRCTSSANIQGKSS